MPKIELPPEGIFVGTGVYPTDTDTLMSTMLGHYTWQCQYFGPLDMIDKIIEDNQGNLAQVWGIARGFSPRLLAEWFYALDELGIKIPAPDWENCRHLTQAEYADVFAEHADRFGAGLVRFIREARQRGIYTAFLYTDARTEWVQEMAPAGGPFYLGYDFGERYNIGLNEARKILAEKGRLNLAFLADSLVEKVKEHVQERKASGWGHIMATSSNFHLDYEVLGGADIPVVEDFAFPSLNFASGLSRGLYRQHQLPLWGSHLAHEHYAWQPNSDSFRYEMLRTALYLKYMAGSKLIINESGNWFVEHTLAPDSPKFAVPQTARDEFGTIGWGQAKRLLEEKPQKLKELLAEARPFFSSLNYDSPISRKYRQIISDFWDFVKANGTPEGQPETTIALAKGNNDLATARYNHSYAINGLYDLALADPNWFQGAPERGWKLARQVFFPEVPVLKPYVNIHLSGTPYGQVDVVSFARDKVTADFLSRNYKALLFAGWNTSSEEQYEILKDYVSAGGTLFIALPQLATTAERSLDFPVESLVRAGDFSELCGVKVLGRGENIYWATVPPGSDKLGCTFPRRFGILGVPLGRLELVGQDLEILAVDDEEARPVLTLHRYGRGKCYFLNTWAYPGALDLDEGPGGLLGSAGLPGYIYRAIAAQSRGQVWITDDKIKPAEECDHVAFSYFPKSGTICLLNIDFTGGRTIWLHQFGLCEKIRLGPAEFKMIATTKQEGVGDNE